MGRLRLKDNTEMLLGSWWCCAALADQTGEEYINIYLFSLGLAKTKCNACPLTIGCGATSGRVTAHEAEQQALMALHNLISTDLTEMYTSPSKRVSCAGNLLHSHCDLFDV